MKGNFFDVCELCKVLSNPLRLEMLSRVYSSKDGFNVSILATKMMKSMGVSAVSQYLKQLERVGLICRRREGLYVNYYADSSRVPPATHDIIDLIRTQLRAHKSRTFARAFPALGNPFRAKVVGMLSRAGSLSAQAICAKTDHELRHLKRDLQLAVKSGLIDPNDDDVAQSTYHYIPPTDPIIRLLIERIVRFS
jgi:DNA-binding transcriptional ArsR family regulator